MNILVEKIGVYGVLGVGVAIGIFLPMIVQKTCQLALAIFKGIKNFVNSNSIKFHFISKTCNSCCCVPNPTDTGSFPPKYDDKKF